MAIPVPMVPAFIRGVINLRGSVVPVVDLAVRFGSQAAAITKRTAIVIVELEDETEKMDVGVVVDRVNEVLDIANEDIEPPPSFGAKIRTDFIHGMGKVDERFIILLNMCRVLSVDELSMINKVQHQSPVTDEGS